MPSSALSRRTAVFAASLGLGLAAVLGAASSASASSDYPNRPLKMYVGFSAGSATDVVARTVAQKLSERLGQPVVVDNRTGAGGTLAAEAAARSAPDGYTLLTVSSAIAISPAVYPNLRFDVEKDLSAVFLIGALPTVLEVNAKMPVKDLREFIAYAKERPGKLNYGSSGNGGSIHLSTELLASLSGIKMAHVPYRGNDQAATAVMAGEVDVLIDTLLLAAQTAKSNRVRPLAITGKARSPLMPDVPTFAEAGLPEYDASIFFGILAPAGVPRDIVARLEREMAEVIKSPEVRARLADSGGITMSGETSEGFGRMLRDEVTKWKRIARDAGVSLN
ncbi:MAG: tripartite tricarboxylate transporter substrate binding protein [Burkholderiaceae bacterium]